MVELTHSFIVNRGEKEISRFLAYGSIGPSPLGQPWLHESAGVQVYAINLESTWPSFNSFIAGPF